MRRFILAAPLLALSVAAPRAQEALTANQRDADLGQLANMLAKQYAPYEWKRDVVGFDLYRLNPWLQRVHRADDLEFEEALVDYVASLDDAHATITFPSNFSASLGFTVDIYDGKALVDSVNRALLPAAQFPFDVGDELVALDGQPIRRTLASFAKYFVGANVRTTARGAAIGITDRLQTIMPHAPEVGEAAVASIRLASTGAVNSHTIPWAQSGFGLASQGPVPSPRRGNGRIVPSRTPEGSADDATAGVSRELFQMPRVSGSALPPYMNPIRPLLNVALPSPLYAVRGLGARSPVYGPPPGFAMRLGTQASHFFLSGTYVSNGVRIGLIRIPTMAPPNVVLALQQLDQEIAFFNANTDVLVVDAMRNPGGRVDVVEAFAQRLFSQPFRTVGFEIRATAEWLTEIVEAVDDAERFGAPARVIQNLRSIMDAIRTAYDEGRGRTAPVPLGSDSLTVVPAPNAYTRPVLLLVDEFTASGGDMFAAIVQDDWRETLFGMRTMGAGGAVGQFNCTTFTESVCTITLALMNRGTVISAPGFPPSPYLENVGVRPEIVVDYMTRANLTSGGAPFVQAFTNAAVKLAQAPVVQP